MRLHWMTGAAILAACMGPKTQGPVVTTTRDGSTTSEAGTAAAQKGKSLVRFVNTIPEGTLDLATDNRVTFYGVDYRTVTPYTEIEDNLVKFKVRSADGDSVLAESTESLGDGYRYTVVAMPTSDRRVTLEILRDEVVPEAGKARLRVIQASPALTDVDVGLSGRKDLVFDNLAYGTGAGYKDVDPGAATVEIRPRDAPVSPLRLKNVHLTAGAAYTIVVTGSKPGTVQTISFNDVVRPRRPAGS